MQRKSSKTVAETDFHLTEIFGLEEGSGADEVGTGEKDTKHIKVMLCYKSDKKSSKTVQNVISKWQIVPFFKFFGKKFSYFIFF